MLVYVTTEQVQCYEKCKLAKHARALFAKYHSNSKLSMTRTNHCVMRDHLFSAIHFSTGHRSGGTANMTLNEFEKAKEVEDNTHIIKVWDRETVDVYCPASVVLANPVYDLVKNYIALARRTSTKTANVFTSWSGASISSGKSEYFSYENNFLTLFNEFIIKRAPLLNQAKPIAVLLFTF